MRIYFTILISSILRGLISQDMVLTTNDSLSIWSDILFNSSLPKTRALAASSLECQLANLLSTNSLDTNLLNSNIVRLKIPDQQIDIYSYQFEVNKDEFDYSCFLKMANGEIVKLKREWRDYQRIRREEFDENNWYGAVYYHIVPKLFGKDTYYILFGFAQNNMGEKFKIVETLKLNNNQIKFGIPAFQIVDEANDKDILNRLVIRYSKNSSCLLRYEEGDNQIIFDHIISYEDPNTPQMQYYLPDGSYEALEWRDNQWNYIPKLKTETIKAAPRERPVLDNKSKDLFGKDRK